MKNLIFIASLLMIISVTAQESDVSYEQVGDLVKKTSFYENGNIKEQGFFKNKVITGVWTRFDEKGNKTVMANYNNGKKVGKWFMWTKDELKEIDYENNTIANVQSWKHNMNIATN